MSARRWLGWLSLAVILVGVGVWRWLDPSPSTQAPPAGTATPVRIASLTLGTDEILSELVPPERIVCVTYLADDPEISNVPGFYPDGIPRLRDTAPERILGLNPDLVCVAPYNSADFLKVMERAGFATYRNDACHNMDEIEAGILALGKRVGEPGRAQELVERMRVRRKQLVRRLQDVPHRPRVLYWSAGFTAGHRTTIDDIIREAGGRNVATERNLEGSAEISPEQVIAADPEYILLSRWSADERAGHIENHPLLRHVRAVQEKRVIAIEGRYLTSVSHFVVEGAERLAGKLHPDRFNKDGPSPPAPAPARLP
jgi:iron complex transport system substrate-binding protein